MFQWGNLRERDPDVDRRIIRRWIFRKCDMEVWTGIFLAQARDRWLVLVNAVMNLRVP